MTSLDSDPTSELELPTWRRTDINVERAELEIDADTAGLQRPGAVQRDPAVLRKTEFELEQKRALVKGLEAERKSQQSIINDQNAALNSLRADIESLQADLAASDELLAGENQEKQNLLAVRDALETDIAQQAAAIEQSDDRISALAADLENLASELAARTAERDELQATLQTVSRKTAKDKPQSALVTALRHEIRDLNTQLAAAERLNDATRHRLQDATKDADTNGRKVIELEASLDEQLAHSAERQTALDALEATEQELKTRLATIEAEHAEELRRVRFELSEAEQTIGQHELINHQLASDLVENRSLKDRLEAELTDTGVTAKNELLELEKQLRLMTQKHDDVQAQLGSKNEAINCLLKELADYRSQPGTHREVEPQATADTGENPGMTVNEVFADDRISRYLTGVVDGQEIRFPLFKPRLTIGRTQSNDLQLSPNFISRRHAVIVTEAGRTRIIDWGSRNGIKVNNQPVTEHFLDSGDLVSVGTFEFLYEERRRH